MNGLRRLAAVAALTALGSSAAVADRVRLVNGRVFADVVAVRLDDRVEIRLGGGTITLPLAQVASVESSASTLEEYSLRARDLRSRGAGAADWLALARWAQERQFEFGVREAALEAAALAPELAGLAALMPALGYALDEGSGRWVPIEEAMRRRGWVEDDGDWVPAALAAARAGERQARAEAARRAREAERLARLAALAEAQAAAQAASAPPAVDPWGYGWGGWGFPVLLPPFAVGGARPGHGPPPVARPPEPPRPPGDPPARPAHTTSAPPRG